MKSDWYVMHNPMGGYIAARVRDTSEVVHSGNLEFSGEYSGDKSKVEKLVEELNKNEKNTET